MTVTTLLENTACQEGLCHAHGFSLWLQTPLHRILFDMGPNGDFLKNAEQLGVDVSQADIAFLSHGHSDHGGGLEAFFDCNQQAKVHLQQTAPGDYWAVRGEDRRYIGIDTTLPRRFAPRFVFTDGVTELDEELTVFSGVDTHDLTSAAAAALREKQGEDFPADAFAHEQHLLIRAEGKTVLVCGCCHTGVVNILRRAESLLGQSPDAVLGGFHLCDPSTGAPEDEQLLAAVAQELAARPHTHYYTGHCTGLLSYGILRMTLGRRMHYLSTGTRFTL